jgi:glycopeptide antibiotics resistance protein
MLRLKAISISYLFLLLLVSVVPLGSMNATLNDNYTLHIRWDYLLHTLVYLPLPFLLALILKTGSIDRTTDRSLKKTHFFQVLLLAGVIVVSFELVQKILPYRSFNINDMLANGIGAVLGLILLRIFGQNLFSLIIRRSSGSD